MKKMYVVLNILMCSVIILLNIFNYPMFYNSYGLESSTYYNIDFSENDNPSEIIEYFFNNNISFGVEYLDSQGTLEIFYTDENILNDFMKNNKNFSIGYTNFQVRNFNKYNMNYDNISQIYTNTYEKDLDQMFGIEYGENTHSYRYFFRKLILNFLIIILICSSLQIIISKISFIKNKKNYIIFYIYSKKKLFLKHYLFDIISYWGIGFLLLSIFLIPFIRDFNRYNIIFLMLILLQLIIVAFIKYFIFSINSKKLIKLNIREQLANKSMSIGIISHLILTIFSFLAIISLVMLLNILGLFVSQIYQINYIRNNLSDYTYISSAGVPNYYDSLKRFVDSNKDNIIYSSYDSENNVLYASEKYLKEYMVEYDSNCEAFVSLNNEFKGENIAAFQDIPSEKVCYYKNNYSFVNLSKTYHEKIKVYNPTIIVNEVTSQFWISNAILPSNLEELPIIYFTIGDFIYDTYVNFIYPMIFQIVKMSIMLIIYIFILKNFYIYYWGKVNKKIICKLIVGQTYRKNLLYYSFIFQKYIILSVLLIFLLNVSYLKILLIIMILNYLLTYFYLKNKSKKEFMEILKEK